MPERGTMQVELSGSSRDGNGMVSDGVSPRLGKGGGQRLGRNASLASRNDRGPNWGLWSQGFASVVGSPVTLLRCQRLDAGCGRSSIGPRRDREELPDTVRVTSRTVSLDPDSGADRCPRVSARCKPGQSFSGIARRFGGRQEPGTRVHASDVTFGWPSREAALGWWKRDTVLGW